VSVYEMLVYEMLVYEVSVYELRLHRLHLPPRRLELWVERSNPARV
jgi:hypothetical protein